MNVPTVTGRVSDLVLASGVLISGVTRGAPSGDKVMHRGPRRMPVALHCGPTFPLTLRPIPSALHRF